MALISGPLIRTDYDEAFNKTPSPTAKVTSINYHTRNSYSSSNSYTHTLRFYNPKRADFRGLGLAFGMISHVSLSWESRQCLACSGFSPHRFSAATGVDENEELELHPSAHVFSCISTSFWSWLAFRSFGRARSDMTERAHINHCCGNLWHMSVSSG